MTDGQYTGSHRASSFAPSDYDSDGSLHTIDDDTDAEISSYEDCVDDGENDVDDDRRAHSQQMDRTAVESESIGSRHAATRRFVDIGDEEITFRDRAAADSEARDNYRMEVDRGARGRRTAVSRRPDSGNIRDRDATSVKRQV